LTVLQPRHAAGVPAFAARVAPCASDLVDAGPDQYCDRLQAAKALSSNAVLGPVPNRRSISPIINSNWEGVGVVPDIAVAPATAMAAAKDLLQRQIRGTPR
jgi:hypothetical protein